MKIVVVSPHRDDACFSLGLCIGSWIEAGHSVTVVNCFTQSDYAPHATLRSGPSVSRTLEVSALRLREDEAWQQMYPSNLHFIDLNMKDAPLRLHIEADQVIGRPAHPRDQTMTELPKAIASVNPDVVVIPLALGGHVDHVTVRTAMTSTGPAQSPGKLPIAFYEDLPYAAWPNLAESVKTVARKIDKDLVPVFWTKEALIEGAVERKRRLALCYDSQIEVEVAERIAAFSAGYGGRERLWVSRSCVADLFQ